MYCILCSSSICKIVNSYIFHFFDIKVHNTNKSRNIAYETNFWYDSSSWTCSIENILQPCVKNETNPIKLPYLSNSMHLLKFLLCCFIKSIKNVQAILTASKKLSLHFCCSKDHFVFSSHVYLTHTRKICYNNANNNTHISIFCDRHVCHSSLTSFGTLLQVYAHTRYNFYIEYAIMQEREERERERERN